MTDDALWRAQAAARPGYCTYPPTRTTARSRSGVDDDQARRRVLAGLGPPLPEEREQARLAMLQRDDPAEYARVLGLPTPEEAARLRHHPTRGTSQPRPAEPNPAGIPGTASPPRPAQTRLAARLGGLLHWRKP